MVVLAAVKGAIHGWRSAFSIVIRFVGSMSIMSHTIPTT